VPALGNPHQLARDGQYNSVNGEFLFREELVVNNGSNTMASLLQPPTELPSDVEWKETLQAILPRQGEWSEEEYLVLTDHRSQLVEYTDGWLEVLPMPTDKHQTVLKFLFLTFFGYFETRGGSVQFAPLRLRIRPGKF
jgi:hypothetical protein